MMCPKGVISDLVEEKTLNLKSFHYTVILDRFMNMLQHKKAKSLFQLAWIFYILKR